MKKTLFPLVTSLLCLSLSACNISIGSDDDSPVVYDFAKDSHNFEAIFSDYPKGEEAFFQLIARHQVMPEEYGDDDAWLLSGNNHSDDLLMAIKGAVSGLRAHTLYQVSLDIEFLTNTPSNCAGIGGAPGESVFVKLAAATEEPANSLEDNYWRLNTDIGIQAQSGTEGVVVGNIANGVDCNNTNNFNFLPKSLSTEEPIDVMSDANGKIWLLAATDSGFEGRTSIYITKLTATITE